MKYLLCFTALIALLICIPQSAFAHNNGIPTVKINNKPLLPQQAYQGYVDQKLLLPQDLAPERYLPNTLLEFEIIKENLPLPPETVDKIEFRWGWDFEDEVYALGPKATHSYKNIGSHYVTLEAKIPGNPDFVVYDSIQVDIVPNLNYQLPQAVITTPTEVQPNKEITFSARVTTDPSTAVDSYLWKVDQNTYSTNAEVKHIYKSDPIFEYVYLQIKDKNNFMYTAVKTVYSKKQTNTQVATANIQKTNSWINTAVIILTGVIIITTIVAIKKWRSL